MRKAVIMNPNDNVATAVTRIEPGQETDNVTIAEMIPMGHKFALRKIAQGDDIVKYGSVIGRATAEILPGMLVHVHNVESLRGRGDIGGDNNG